MREAVKHLRHDDAVRAVDRAAEQQAFQKALIAEQVDERDRGQERWREQRQHGGRVEQPLEAHLAARQRIGIAERERDHDHGGDERDPDAVEDRVEQARRREIAHVVRKPDEFAVRILEAFRQQRPERQCNGQDKPRHQQHHADARHPGLARDLLRDPRYGCRRNAHASYSAVIPGERSETRDPVNTAFALIAPLAFTGSRIAPSARPG